MKDYMHICIVLDAYGFKSSIEDDTKGSFNSFLKSQKEASLGIREMCRAIVGFVEKVRKSK